MQRRRLASLAACLLLAPALGVARRRALAGTVVRVSDGDTFWVEPAGGGRPVKVRLQGIDAPEICQPWGEQAKRALEALALGQRVRVESVAVDAHGRSLARVLRDDEDLAAALVRAGQAWSHRFRGYPGPYAAEESAARAERRGLFADPAAVPPRSFRRAHGRCA